MSSTLCPEQNVLINTPQTLGVTPRYVLQHNAISRSINSLSATAKKLTVMAMALIPPDLSTLTAAFTFPEFCKALDMPIGGETYKIFKAAVNECMQCVITIETEPNAKGKKTWRKFTWFSEAQYNEETSKATMTFSPKLAEVMKELKWVYSKINLQDFGALQSRYAIRLYEIALSFAYLKGKQGNKDGVWYFQWTIEELRQILSVPADAYTETHLFKQKVIDAPIKEINSAGLGLAIKIERVKQGRFLVALRFDCEQAPRHLPAKGENRKKTAAPLELPEPNPQVEQERLEKEYQHMKERYPDEFARLYEEALNKPSPLPLNSLIRQGAAEYVAVTRLKAKHGIVK
ncbi:MAG: replication initiation protein [Treponema sp.]|nr:replication initiation protein [Treponema sp.]